MERRLWIFASGPGTTVDPLRRTLAQLLGFAGGGGDAARGVVSSFSALPPSSSQVDERSITLRNVSLPSDSGGDWQVATQLRGEGRG